LRGIRFQIGELKLELIEQRTMLRELLRMSAAQMAAAAIMANRLPFVSAFISADAVETSTDPEIRICPPSANSISITSTFSGNAGDTAPDSGVTAIGWNAEFAQARRVLGANGTVGWCKSRMHEQPRGRPRAAQSPRQQSVPSPPVTSVGDAAPT
jgi:hypothetical protein